MIFSNSLRGTLSGLQRSFVYIENGLSQNHFNMSKEKALFSHLRCANIFFYQRVLRTIVLLSASVPSHSVPGFVRLVGVGPFTLAFCYFLMHAFHLPFFCFSWAIMWFRSSPNPRFKRDTPRNLEHPAGEPCTYFLYT